MKYLPLHWSPSPENPLSHWQVKEPSLSVQVALWWQLWVFNEHSSMSGESITTASKLISHKRLIFTSLGAAYAIVLFRHHILWGYRTHSDVTTVSKFRWKKLQAFTFSVQFRLLLVTPAHRKIGIVLSFFYFFFLFCFALFFEKRSCYKLTITGKQYWGSFDLFSKQGFSIQSQQK